MKRNLFVLGMILLFAVGVKGSDIVTENNKPAKWEDIIVTKKEKEVENLVELGEVEGKASKVFGSRSSLRKKAIENLKKNAFKLEATHVLIEEDDFSNSPINNVYMLGTAYKAE